jgi:nucleotide-binding universal stress UspA family protein
MKEIPMFERILVPLDGSERAEAVLGQIDPILRSEDAEIILFRAVEPWTDGYSPNWETTQSMQLKFEEESRAYLSKIENRLRDQGARVRSLLGQAPAADSILRAASQEGASLIAMSTHGRTGLARWVFGSVAEKILRTSPIPLFLVRSLNTDSKGGHLPKKILVPIDAADPSLDVVPCAVEIARLFGARVILLNVCEDHPQCSVAVPQMTRADEQFRKAGVSSEPVMRKGDPASEILDACEEQGADLIALATHGRSGVSRWVLGSVAEKVLRNAIVPLLVVRCPKATPREILTEAPGEAARTR